MFTISLLTVLGCSSSNTKEPNGESDTVTEGTKIETSKETLNKASCEIVGIAEENGKFYITVDYVNILSGKEAEDYCKKKNIPVYDTYIIENEQKEPKTFLLADKVEITLLDPMDAKPVAGKSVADLKERASLINAIFIDAKDGVVTRIEQFFTP